MGKQWVNDIISRLAAIGGTDRHGSNRPAFSDEDMAAVNISWN